MTLVCCLINGHGAQIPAPGAVVRAFASVTDLNESDQSQSIELRGQVLEKKQYNSIISNAKNDNWIISKCFVKQKC